MKKKLDVIKMLVYLSPQISYHNLFQMERWQSGLMQRSWNRRWTEGLNRRSMRSIDGFLQDSYYYI